MQAHIVLISVYAAFRVVHTVVYSLKMSKARTAAFGVGHFALFGLCTNAIVAAFTATYVNFAG